MFPSRGARAALFFGLLAVGGFPVLRTARCRSLAASNRSGGFALVQMTAAAAELKVAAEQDSRSIYFDYQGSRKGGHEVSEGIGRRPHVNGQRRIVIGAFGPESRLAHRARFLQISLH